MQHNAIELGTRVKAIAISYADWHTVTVNARYTCYMRFVYVSWHVGLYISFSVRRFTLFVTVLTVSPLAPKPQSAHPH